MTPVCRVKASLKRHGKLSMSFIHSYRVYTIELIKMVRGHFAGQLLITPVDTDAGNDRDRPKCGYKVTTGCDIGDS